MLMPLPKEVLWDDLTLWLRDIVYDQQTKQLIRFYSSCSDRRRVYFRLWEKDKPPDNFDIFGDSLYERVLIGWPIVGYFNSTECSNAFLLRRRLGPQRAYGRSFELNSAKILPPCVSFVHYEEARAGLNEVREESADSELKYLARDMYFPQYYSLDKAAKFVSENTNRSAAVSPFILVFRDEEELGISVNERVVERLPLQTDPKNYVNMISNSLLKRCLNL